MIAWLIILVVCLCALVLVISFVLFFGPSVLQISPLLKLLVSRQWTRRVSKKCIYLETQLNRMELSANCSKIGNVSSECKGDPGWTVSIKFALVCPPHNSMEFSSECIEIRDIWSWYWIIKFVSVCTLHSRNDQISKKINCVQDWQNIISQRYGSDTSLILC